MPRTRRVLVVVGILLVIAAVVLGRTSLLGRETSATDSLFASSFVDKAGMSQPLAQWRGKVLIINFWASWCSPCLEEMPMLSLFYQKNAAKGMQMIGISVEDAAALKTFEQQLKVEYPLLIGNAEALSLAQSLGNDRSILPFTVVVDKSGKIAQIMFGKVSSSLLEKVVNPLL